MTVAKKAAPAATKAATAKKAAPAAAKAVAAPTPAAKEAPVKKANKAVKPEPLEATEAEYRKPDRPTPTKLSKFAWAVVMLAWFPEKHGSDPASPADRDFEGFDTEDKARIFFEGQVAWAEDDVKDFGDFNHAIYLLDATEPVHINTVTVLATDAEWSRTTKASLLSHPDVIFTTTKKEVVKENVGVAAKKKAKEAPVAARKPSNAAAAVRGKAKAGEADAEGAAADKAAARTKKEEAAAEQIASLNERMKASKEARAKRLQNAAAVAEAAEQPATIKPKRRPVPNRVEDDVKAEAIGTTDIKNFVKAGARRKAV